MVATGREDKFFIVSDRNLEIFVEALESHDDFSCERAAEVIKGIRNNPDLEYKQDTAQESTKPNKKK